MRECEIITILQELFSGVKRSSLVNLTLSEEHQVEMWLDNKLSEAAAQEVIEMKREREEEECEQKGCSYPKIVNAGRTIIDKPSRYEWANISGEYKRERSDWVMLCPSCHRKIDMGKEKLCVV